MRCARVVRKVGYSGPIIPNGHGAAVTTVFPCAGLLMLPVQKLR